MDLDIKGENGHMGYVINLTLVIHIVIHRPREMWCISHATRRVWT